MMAIWNISSRDGGSVRFWSRSVLIDTLTSGYLESIIGGIGIGCFFMCMGAERL